MTAEAPPPRLTWRGVAILAASYVVLALLYAGAIGISDAARNGWSDPVGTFGPLIPRQLLDYAIKGLLTLPVWWIVVRGMDGRSLRSQLAAHAVLGPIWVGLWFWLYRLLAEPFGYFVLTNGGEIWDLYIPAIIYAGTFAGLHAARNVEKERFRAAREHTLHDAARQAELSALKAQLNPHFLFNTLNSISASVPPEQEHTRALVSRLAHLMRYALDASRRDLVLLDEELRFTDAYLDLERERLGDRLAVEWDVDADARSALIPPMLVQPLVENAVRHGIAPSLSGGTVTVSVRLRGSTLAVEVRDSGLGLADGVDTGEILSRGVGLGTTHERLRAMGGEGVRVDATPGERGFAVSFAMEVDAREALAPTRAASPDGVHA